MTFLQAERAYQYDEFRLGTTLEDVLPTPALRWDTNPGAAGAQGGGGTWAHAGPNWLNADGNANVKWDNAAYASAGQAAGIALGNTTGRERRGLGKTNDAAGLWKKRAAGRRELDLPATAFQA